MERWTLLLLFLSLISLFPLFFIDQEYYYIPKFISLIFLVMLLAYNAAYICKCASFFAKNNTAEWGGADAESDSDKSRSEWTKAKEGAWKERAPSMSDTPIADSWQKRLDRLKQSDS